VTNCQLSINAAIVSTAVCALGSGTNIITFSQLGVSQTVNNLSISFNTSTALYSGSFIVSLKYYSPTNTSIVYNTNSVSMSIVNAVMPCSITSTSNMVGATANYTIVYTPSVYISPASIVQIRFPAWSTYTQTNFPSFLATTVCAGNCTQIAPSSTQNYELISYSSLYSSNSTAQMSLTMSQARNPASTQPISVTVTILANLTSTSQPSYMTCSTSFSVTNPSNFRSITFNPNSLAISATNTVSLLLNLTNPISSISYLRITSNTDLTLTYSYITSNQLTTQVVFPTSSSNVLLIGNLTNSTNIFLNLFLQSFTLTNAPYANLPTTIIFQT